MTITEYLKELSAIKADLEANAPSDQGLDGALAFAHHQRKLGLVNEMMSQYTYPEGMLVDDYSVYDADFAIIDLLRRINTVGL